MSGGYIAHRFMFTGSVIAHQGYSSLCVWGCTIVCGGSTVWVLQEGRTCCTVLRRCEETSSLQDSTLLFDILLATCIHVLLLEGQNHCTSLCCGISCLTLSLLMRIQRASAGLLSVSTHVPLMAPCGLNPGDCSGWSVGALMCDGCCDALCLRALLIRKR